MHDYVKKQCNCSEVILKFDIELDSDIKQYCRFVNPKDPSQFFDATECATQTLSDPDTRNGKNVLCNCMWLCEEYRYNFKTSATDWPKDLQIKDFLFTYVDKSSNSAGKCKC